MNFKKWVKSIHNQNPAQKMILDGCRNSWTISSKHFWMVMKTTIQEYTLPYKIIQVWSSRYFFTVLYYVVPLLILGRNLNFGQCERKNFPFKMKGQSSKVVFCCILRVFLQIQKNLSNRSVKYTFTLLKQEFDSL